MKARDYELRDPPRTEAASMELRVHGVGGTSPESILATDDVVRVRGDDTAGFYRPADPPPSRAGSTPIDLEAYSWGGLTSRSATRALWVVLTPFALINVAGWMLPPAPSADDSRRSRWSHRVAVRGLRLIGLMATALLIFWLAQLAMDLASYQCGGSTSCRASNAWLGFFGGEFFLLPGRRLVAGALVPALAILVLWWLSRVTRGRYEAEYPFDDPGLEASAADARASLPSTERESFADPTFWKRSASLKSFVTLHTTASRSILALMISVAMLSLYDTDSSTPGVAVVLTTGLAIAAFAILIASAGSVLLRSVEPEEDPSSLTAIWVIGIAIASGAVLGAAAVVAIVWPASVVTNRLPFLGVASTFGAVWLVVLVVFIGALVLHPGRSSEVATPIQGDIGLRVAYRGFASLLAILLAFFLLLLVFTGLSAGLARLLGGRAAVDYPIVYDALAIASIIVLVTLIASVAVTFFTSVRRVSLEALHTSFPGEDGQEPPGALGNSPRSRRKWLEGLRRAEAIRVMVPRIELGLALTLLVGLLVVIADRLVRLFDVNLSEEALDLTPGWLESAAFWLLAVGVPFGLYFLARRSVANPRMRKSVGVLWDVLTFWPRWNHPLAPPSYAGRAIPELRTRLHVLSNDEQYGTIVVSAHSQGAVLALAALDGLRSQSWFETIGLITHGNPSTRLYLRYFPAHVRAPTERIATQLANPTYPKWINLYRLTDPIGGAVEGEYANGEPIWDQPPDRMETWGIFNPLADPDIQLAPTVIRFPRAGDPYPGPLGHSNYYATAEYDRALSMIASPPAAGRIRTPPRPGAARAPRDGLDRKTRRD